jgi:hypothetical protein
MMKNSKTKPTFKQSALKSLQTFKDSLPIMVGVILFINLVEPLVGGFYFKFFSDNRFLDSLLGAVFGSVSFGIPITSYVVGGELLEKGISLLAVTAFIMAWTTVGLAMLPLEAKFLSYRFAIFRNLINFFFAIIIAFLTIFTLNVFNF